MAQLVLGAAGAFVGAIFGGPMGAQLGWALGSALGGSFGPTQKSQGPRLTDLKVTGTEYGQPIPWVQGHPIIAGQIWWSSDRREIATTTEVGKGGPSAEQTTYTYEVDLLLGLTDNEIAGVSRIFINGKLIYTSLLSASDESLHSSAQTEAWTRMTVYTGEDTQLPDPTYEAAVGTANAPAYRGRGAIFFEGLQLGNSGQIPNITVEVLTSGTFTNVSASGYWSPTDKTSQFSVGGSDNRTASCPVSIPATAERIRGTAARSTGKRYCEFLVTSGEDTTIDAFGLAVGIGKTTPALSTGSATFSIGSDDVCLTSFGRVVCTSGSTIGATGVKIENGHVVSVAANLDSGDVWFAVNGAWLSGNPETGESPAADSLPSGIYVPGLCHQAASSSTSVNVTLRVLDDDFSFPIPSGYTSWADPSPIYGITVADETLSDVVSRLCLRAGLDASQFDVTALASITKPVRAFAASQIGNTRSLLEILSSAYYFECVLSDKLRFVQRGGASALTIPFADLGASSNPLGADEPLALRPLNELEVPAQVAVSYLNIDTECQRDTQMSDRLISSVQTTSSIELPLGLTADEAKGIAQSMVMDGIASAMSVKVSLLPTYSRLEPTDVITVTAADGSTIRVRLVKKSDAGVLDFDAVLDDAAVLIDAGITSSDYEPAVSVAAPAETVLQLLDIPILRDGDNAPGIYVAAKGSSSPWAGGAIYRSTDDIQFDQVATVTESGVFGVATTVLADFTGGYVFDLVSTLTVDVGLGELSSTSRVAMLLDDTVNALLVGDEVVRFLSASLVSTGVYTLSGLLRGQRGTEWAMSGHALSERVVLLQTRGIRRLTEQSSDIGISRYYKGVTLGRRLSTASSEAFTDTGVALKPFAPVHARGERDTDGNMVLSWMRRTRLATRFAGAAGISVPLGEDVESYEVDIFDDSGFSTLVRTLTSDEESVEYPPDMVSTDFGAVQTTLHVRIYQISATVGRGYPLQASVGFGAALPEPVIVYTGSGATKNLVSNIDARTNGVLLQKGLIGIGTPNAALIYLSGTTADMNTSAVSGAVTSSGNFLGTLGLTMSSSSSYNTASMQSVAVFLPKRADLFERISWTGDGTGDRSLSHSIGVAPALAFVKRRDNADSWKMYSSQAGANKSLTFPSSGGAAFGTDTASFPNASTSTLFKVGAALNVSGAFYEALVFSGTSSLVDEGTYTGNGSSTGPTVSLTYKPRLLLIRSLGATNRFTLITSDRLDATSYKHWLIDDQGAAASTTSLVTLTSSGFEIVSADGTVNENGVSYQYVALQPWE